jgi:hypothetical protein
VTSLGRPVFLVSGDGFGELTKKFSDLVEKDERNEVITYPGAIFGYLLCRNDKELEPKIASWLREQLGGEKAANVSNN